MQLELTRDEIIHLAHCAHKMNRLADRSRVIAEALGIDIAYRAKLNRITLKILHQADKHLTPAQKQHATLT